MSRHQNASPSSVLEALLQSTIKKLFPQQADIVISVDESPRPEFGDYSSSAAFVLAKKTDLPSHAVALRLKEALEKSGGKIIKRVDVAGNGFLNFFVTQAVLHQSFASFRAVKYPARKEKTIIEFSSPNVAKPLHLGNFRATILGDFLARLYEFLGYRVVRWNHPGDWGTQFGKLIVAYRKWGDLKKISKNPIKELLALYVRFHKETKKNSSLEDEARAEFRKLENGDKKNTALLSRFLKESFKEFSALYKQLDVRFDVILGESFYAKESKSIIRELEKRGVAKRSEGALVVPLDNEKMPPALLQKSDGATLYMTRDLASVSFREKKHHPRQLIYVVGSEQALHFRQLFAVTRRLSFSRADLVHVSFGAVLGEDGKKLSTREGTAVTAKELMDKVLLLARRAITKRKLPYPETEKKLIAAAVGIGALKYNTLKEARESNVFFDYEKMLSFSGNSGPYLQYTAARFSRILKKSGAAGRKDLSLLETRDESLMKKILQFHTALEQSRLHHSPHFLCAYLYELATEANAFYEHTPVLSDKIIPRKNARLFLIKKITETLGAGLSLLGIRALPRI